MKGPRRPIHASPCEFGPPGRVLFPEHSMPPSVPAGVARRQRFGGQSDYSATHLLPLNSYDSRTHTPDEGTRSTSTRNLLVIVALVLVIAALIKYPWR